jgi:acyl-CoA reductase-like NAD-dependent aldehyde dehydrogenase
VRNAAEELRSMAGREIPMGLTPASAGRRAFTIVEPIGVVVAISAFNHPLNLILHQVVPAIAVGCPVIVKPALPTPLAYIEFVRLVYEAGLPPEWCQVFLAETNVLAEALATDPRIAFTSFIGSARVGWHLRSKLAPGTRCALDHGGAALVIIDGTADLDRLIEPLVKGGYYHAGQVCVSVQRIFVHTEVEAAFLERFAARVAQLQVGDPLQPETEVGPLIHPREADRVAAWTKEAGARLIGGGYPSSTTLRPAIIANPPAEAKVSRWKCSARSRGSIPSPNFTMQSLPPIRSPWRFRPASSPRTSGRRSRQWSVSTPRLSWLTTTRPSAPTGCPSPGAANPFTASAAFLGRWGT